MHQHGQVAVIHGNKGNSASKVLERQVNSPGTNRMRTESNRDRRELDQWRKHISYPTGNALKCQEQMRGHQVSQ